jgi:hypothetical protein
MTPTKTQPLLGRLLRPIDGAWLAALRVLLGLSLAVSMWRFTGADWIHRYFVEPRFFFKYWGFEWVEVLSARGMHVLIWSLLTLALCMAAGLAFRLSALLFTLGLVYLQLIDVSTYLNHYYLAALLALLLALSPAGRVWSIDAWLAQRLGRAQVTTVSAVWLYLFRFQIGLVYVFAGLAKLQSDWLLHAQPLRIWLSASTDLPVLGPLFTLPWVPLAMSWGGFLFDTFIVAFLLHPRTRLGAYGVLVVFHVLTRLLLPIGMFPVIMTVSALARAVRTNLTRSPCSDFGDRSAPRASTTGSGTGSRLLRLAAGAAPQAPGLRGQRAVARAGHAFRLARDGARQRWRHHLRRAQRAPEPHLACQPARLLDPDARSRDVEPARPDRAAGPAHPPRFRAARSGPGRGAR